jgi:hypothetical protein
MPRSEVQKPIKGQRNSEMRFSGKRDPSVSYDKKESILDLGLLCSTHLLSFLVFLDNLETDQFVLTPSNLKTILQNSLKNFDYPPTVKARTTVK